MIKALEGAGYFEFQDDKTLVLLDDLFDGGTEAVKLQAFIFEHFKADEMVLVRRNHEDLFERLITEDKGRRTRYNRQNGSYDTALQLAGIPTITVFMRPRHFAEASRQTPYYQEIVPRMLDYYETEHYTFTRGWLPCEKEHGNYAYDLNWRIATAKRWRKARWYNGMDAVQTAAAEKTVVCGHWPASYAHSRFEGIGSVYGCDADSTPYHARRIIAIGADARNSERINALVLED